MKRTKTSQPIASSAVITLTEASLKDIQIALLQREVTASRVREALAQAEKAVGDAFVAAGLDPTKHYTLDRATLTAAEVVK